jgi:hypothetical protein
LILSQRYVKDIIDVSLFDKENQQVEDNIFINAFILYSALKRNLELDKYKLIRWYQFKIKKEKKEIESLISVQSIMAKLSFEELNEWCEKVYELDFGPANGKKKVQNQPISES